MGEISPEMQHEIRSCIGTIMLVGIIIGIVITSVIGLIVWAAWVLLS